MHPMHLAELRTRARRSQRVRAVMAPICCFGVLAIGAAPAARAQDNAGIPPAVKPTKPAAKAKPKPAAKAKPKPVKTDGEVIVVESRPPAESASSVHFSAKELSRRPHSTPSDLLRQTPGLMVSQHAGGGKADQLFLRGFDADHGTDVAMFVDDVPVNMTSHGHGQGYADTHWVIPETIKGIDVHKGRYSARFGDFTRPAPSR